MLLPPRCCSFGDFGKGRSVSDQTRLIFNRCSCYLEQLFNLEQDSAPRTGWWVRHQAGRWQQPESLTFCGDHCAFRQQRAPGPDAACSMTSAWHLHGVMAKDCLGTCGTAGAGMLQLSHAHLSKSSNAALIAGSGANPARKINPPAHSMMYTWKLFSEAAALLLFHNAVEPPHNAHVKCSH